MKTVTGDSSWNAEQPRAAQASRIVAAISIAGALIYGLIVLPPLLSGSSLGSTDMLFAVAATHLLFQSGMSTFSSKAGATFGMISLLLIFVAVTRYLVQLDFASTAVSTMPAIVSIAAVKIQVNETKLTVADEYN